MIRYLLLVLFLYLNSFCAFVNPLEANQVWEQEMKERKFPILNTGIVLASSTTGPEFSQPEIGSCVIIGSRKTHTYALTSLHIAALLAPNSRSVIGVGNPLPSIPLALNGDTILGDDFNAIWKTAHNHSQNSFFKVEKITPLSPATLRPYGPQDDAFLKHPPVDVTSRPESSLSEKDLVEVVAALSTDVSHNSDIRNLGQVISATTDLVVLELDRIVPGAVNLSLQPFHKTLITAYAVGVIRCWKFFTSEILIRKGITPVKAQETIGRIHFPDFLDTTGEIPLYQTRRAGLAHTVYNFSGKAKAFSLFDKLVARDDETFFPKTNASLHPTLTPQELSYCGPFIGGMSGGGLFIHNESGWVLIGMISETLNAMSKKESLPKNLTLDVYQMFSHASLTAIQDLLREGDGAPAVASNDIKKDKTIVATSGEPKKRVPLPSQFQIIHYKENS